VTVVAVAESRIDLSPLNILQLNKIFEATITYMNRPACSLGSETKETNLVGLIERFLSTQIPLLIL